MPVKAHNIYDTTYAKPDNSVAKPKCPHHHEFGLDNEIEDHCNTCPIHVECYKEWSLLDNTPTVLGIADMKLKSEISEKAARDKCPHGHIFGVAYEDYEECYDCEQNERGECEDNSCCHDCFHTEHDPEEFYNIHHVECQNCYRQPACKINRENCW